MSAANYHPLPPSRIDVTDGDRSSVRIRLTTASPAAAPPLAVTCLRLVAARGIADRRPTLGTNVDRARAFPLAVVLNRDLPLLRPAAFSVTAAAGLTLFGRDPHAAGGTGSSSALIST